jgi:hypothetical protein
MRKELKKKAEKTVGLERKKQPEGGNQLKICLTSVWHYTA